MKGNIPNYTQGHNECLEYKKEMKNFGGGGIN